jgi:hypothetical protein
MTGDPRSAPTPNAELVPLGTTRWALWRDAALRGAGFPAERILEICDGDLAEAADRLADGTPAARERYADVYAAATARLSAAIRRTAGDTAFREAVTWQNPDLVRTCLDKAAAGEPRNVRGRNHELAIASYLQRYCVKNDTIGFFGPVGWARIDSDDAGVSVTTGPDLLSRRTTYFESWAVTAVADVIAARPDVWPWLKPRLAPSASLTGWTMRLPFHKPVTLTAHEARVLRQCDGTRTVRDIAGHPPDPRMTAALLRLRDNGVLHIGLSGPPTAWPERDLAERIDAIPDAAVRSRAHRPLAELVDARDTVAAAAGDPERLLKASTALAETFEAITSSAPTRLPGVTYVGRTLVYEDTVRACGVHLGRRVTDAIARPLALLLDSATWLANTIAERHRSRAHRLLDAELARSGERSVPLLRVFTAVLSELVQPRSGAAGNALLDEVVADFRSRWRRVVELPADPATRRHEVSAGAIARPVAREFATGAPLFSCARWHSPDIMIVAASAAMAARGDLRFVLGEVHCASNTLETLLFAAQHPAPDRLRATAAASGLDGRVFSIPRTDSHQASTRMSRSPECLLPSYVYLCLGAESQIPPPGATFHGVFDLAVHRRGDDLVVRHRATGREYDFLETIGEPLSALCAGAFQPFGDADHTPRISIDRLVVARESWTFPAADARWAFVADERQRYAAVRRWRAEHGIPERGFFRVPVERKPMAVDFRSLPMVNLLCKSVRRTAEAGSGTFTVTEMLPDLDELWLRDGGGGPYTAELRLVAVDQAA